MDSPLSFSEIKEKFSKMNDVPYSKPRSSTFTNESSSSSTVPTSEKINNENSSQSLHSAHSTTTVSTISSSSSSPSQTFREASSSLAAILDRSHPQDINGKPNFKKPPVPLPRKNSQENMLSKSPTVLQYLTPDHKIPSNTSAISVRKKLPVPIPPLANQHKTENTSIESLSAPDDQTLNQNSHSDVSIVAGLKKRPMPLPETVNQQQNESLSSDSSSTPQNSTIDHKISSDINIATALNKLAMPTFDSVKQEQSKNISSELPATLQDSTMNDATASRINIIVTPAENVPDSDPIDDTYCELPNETLDTSFSDDDDDDENETSYESLQRSSVNQSDPIVTYQYDISDSQSSSVTLDAMLPSKCMFFEFETKINDYQRRDSQKIIYPTIKAIMPKITTNEINILQRYSNT